MTLSANEVWPAEAVDRAPEVVPALRVRITAEALIYVALAVLALALRLAQLDHMPLDGAQARQALAALRAVNSQVPGEGMVADSPLTFAAQAISFTVLRPEPMSARLPVALAGVALVLAPLLWRRYLNPIPPLAISALLAVSPVAVLAARSSSGVVWTMLLAVVVPWLVLRAVETRRPGWAIAATAGAAAMMLLAEPAGFLTALALAFGVIFAWLTETDPDSPVPASVREIVRGWPWTNGLIAAGVTVLAVGTVFFWLPSGLSAAGNTLWTGLRGFVERTPGAPVAFPLWIGLRYEVGLWLFGVLAVIRAIREGGFFERALAGWTMASLVWTLGYAGAEAAHALWITVPVCILVGLMVTTWITERSGALWRVPGWGVPLHAVLTAAVWAVLLLNLVILGKRLLVDLPYAATDLGALIDRLGDGIYTGSQVIDYEHDQPVEIQEGVSVYPYVLRFIQQRLLLTPLILMVNAVLFFLAGSLWGARTAWRSFALGSLLVATAFSLGLGGRAAFGTPGDPRELWYVDPVTDDVQELETTLETMSQRATGTPNLIEIAALVPQDSSMAWALRNYPHTVFVNGIGPEITSAVVIVPAALSSEPMGADYVGKDLILTRAWERGSLSWRDALMWYYRGDSRIDPVMDLDGWTMVWVRKDVYGVENVIED